MVLDFKVPEDITVVAGLPTLSLRALRAGKVNEHFLDVLPFRQCLLQAGQSRNEDRTLSLIFEFGILREVDLSDPRGLPHPVRRKVSWRLLAGFRYAVEIRNPDYLGPQYLDVLSRHGVAHVLNAWTRMPELQRQAELPEIFSADFIGCSRLLCRERGYEQAVEAFEPYELVREPNEPIRGAMVEIADGARARKKPAFLFVNNWLEGGAHDHRSRRGRRPASMGPGRIG